MSKVNCGKIRCLRVFFICVAMLLLATLLSSCVESLSQQSSRQNTTAPLAHEQQTPANTLAAAQQALARGEYTRAEFLTYTLIERAQGGEAATETVFSVYVNAAVRNKHPNAALSALESWAAAYQGADSTMPWQELWNMAVAQLSSREGRMKAEAIINDVNRSVAAHNLALSYACVQEWQRNDFAGAAEQLENAYMASSAQEKGLFEHALLRELQLLSEQALVQAVAQVSNENSTTFPYTIIQVAKARHDLQQAGLRETAQVRLGEYAHKFALADPTVLAGPASAGLPLGTMAEEKVVLGSGRPVVLVLPLSGQYGAITSKIVAGAELAVAEATAHGSSCSLVVIDSGKPGWTRQITSLPQEVTVIGGPLRGIDYSAIKSENIVQERAFFTFLPSLDGQDEGRTAWRFFTSQQDQVNAVVAFASRLGAKDYAAVYPAEPYGQRMLGLFETTVAAAGGSVAGAVRYQPGNPANWLQRLGELFGVPAAPAEGRPPYQAIFLPDSWKSAEVLIPGIFSYGATRSILLGTSLWEQGSTARPLPEEKYYSLAVFPGAWNGARSSSAVTSLSSGLAQAGKGEPDFWHALGYDFVQFTLQLPQLSRTDTASVNAALQGVQFEWAMAPIRWGADGIASQDLFLFAPRQGRIELLNEKAFAKQLRTAWTEE